MGFGAHRGRDVLCDQIRRMGGAVRGGGRRWEIAANKDFGLAKCEMPIDIQPEVLRSPCIAESGV